MGFEERLAIIIGAKDDGAAAAFSKVGSSAEDAGKKAAASAEAIAAAQTKSKLAAIAAGRAQTDLTVAQRNLAAVTAKSTSTDVQKRRAALAVEAAEVKHAEAARLATRAEQEATRAEKLHSESLTKVSTGAGKAGGALKAGLAVAAVSAGTAVAGFAVKSIGAASDLSESMSKAGVVFGKSAGEVLAFGSTAAKSIGQSKQSAIEAAGTFGNLFVSMGIGQKTSADLSINLVKLASDLASFNNASPAEALEALRSGLTGETEPLRRYGVNLSAAAIQQEALRLGLAKTTAQVGPAATAQAAYSLILEQTKTAQGDFARTSGGLANQQREAAAQAADLAANTGKLLLPALTSAEQAANAALGPLSGLASGLSALPPEAKAAGVGLIATAGAAKTAAVVLPKAKQAATDLVTSIKGIKPGALAAGAALGVLGIAAGALIEHQKQGQSEARGYFDSLIAASGITDTAGQIDLVKRSVADLASAHELGNEKTVQAGLLINDLQAKLASEAQASKLAGQAAAIQARQTDLLSVSITSGSDATRTSGTVQNRFGETVDVATKKITDQKTEVDRLTGAIDSLNGKNISGVEASIAFKDSLAKLGESVKDNGKSLSETTQKGRDNKTAFLEAAKAAQTMSERVGDQKGYDAGRAALIKSRSELERTAVKFGLTKAEVDKLLGSILKIPPAKSVQLRTPGLEAALAGLQHLKATIDRVNGVAVSVRFGSGGTAIQARSKGGEVTGGTPGKDSVPTLLMPGEYVETVEERRANKLRISARGGGQVGGGGAVNVAAGAVVVNVGGTADRTVVPLIRAEIHGALRTLTQQIASGRR